MTASTMNAGRIVKTHGARIAGIVSCVPKSKIENSYFDPAFGKDSVDAVAKMTGVKIRRWVTKEQTTLDLCTTSGIHLLTGLGWHPESVDALIFVSQTPDYQLPASACVMQEKLGLGRNVIAFDVNLGCSGYPYALWLGAMLIQSGAAEKVLLAVGDTISKLVDANDRSTAMLFGDAGTVTAMEKAGDSIAEMTFVLGTDGKGAKNLLVPAGASRSISFDADERLAGKNLNCLYMDGSEIFNFTLKAVPSLVDSLLKSSGQSVVDYDAFLFHQANLFMLNHLAKKSKIPVEKLPTNIRDYGNTSCASIPLLMTTEISQLLLEKNLRLALFGFGVGYSWGGVSLSTDKLDFVEAIEL